MPPSLGRIVPSHAPPPAIDQAMQEGAQQLPDKKRRKLWGKQPLPPHWQEAEGNSGSDPSPARARLTLNPARIASPGKSLSPAPRRLGSKQERTWMAAMQFVA